MLLSPRARLFVQAVDVGLELRLVYAPHPSTSDLDRGELARPHECVSLGDAHVQVGGDVLQGEEARLDLPAGASGRVVTFPLRHNGTIAPPSVRYVDLNAFAWV